MILYNVTVNIDNDAEKGWVEWMNKEHIPDVMATDLFIECRFTKVVADDQGGQTYSIQYLCPDMDSYIKYQNEHAAELQKDHSERYAGKFAAFRTMCEVIEIHGKA